MFEHASTARDQKAQADPCLYETAMVFIGEVRFPKLIEQFLVGTQSLSEEFCELSADTGVEPGRGR